MFEVFDVQERRGAATELLYSFFAFGIIGGVFLFFSISISLISLFSFDIYQVPYTDIALELSWLSDWLTNIIPVIFTFIRFYTIFRYVSERRIQRRDAVIAAIISSILFELPQYRDTNYLAYALIA